MIQWIVSARGIIIGTNGGIFRATGAPITPNNIDVNPECPEGTSYHNAIVINPVVIFVNRTGKQVIGIVYSYESDSYEAEDLSLLCDNLTVNGIVDMVFQSGLNPVVWLADGIGAFLSMTYNRSQKVVAWAHHITSGNIESLAVIPNANEGVNDVYASVQRTLNSVSVRTIEVLDTYMNTDSGLATTFGQEVSHVSGLEHLAGEIVQLVGDDAVYPDVLVDDNGQIEIDPPALKIEIGLGYTSYLKTLKPEVKSDQETIQASQKKWSRIFARLYQTVGIKINGEVVPFRTSTDPMDQGVTPFTGDKRIVNLGWAEEGKIIIEQDLPLPATVLCIFGTLEVN
jgi:hypothetical protein